MRAGPSVLVTAASRHGATSEIAGRIAEVLRRELDGYGWRVDRCEMTEVRDAAVYDVLVVGSAVYMGRWMRSARRLVQRMHGHEFLGIWLFSSGPVDPMDPKPPVARTVLTDHPDIVDHVIVGGALDVQRLSRAERWVVRGLQVPSGDYRNWPEIEAWATTIADRLAVVGRPDHF